MSNIMFKYKHPMYSSCIYKDKYKKAEFQIRNGYGCSGEGNSFDVH